MKKTLIIFIVLILVGVSLWFVWNKSQPESTGLSNVLRDVPVVTQDSVNGEKSTSTKKEVKEENPLRVKALSILSRPPIIKVSLREAAKNQALEKIKQAGELLKNDYDQQGVWLELGAYRKLIGDYDGAIEAWDFLGVIRPQSYISFANLGDLYAFYLKDFGKGERNFLKSIDLEPANINAYMQLATIYEAAKESDKIEPILLRGINNSPSAPILKILLARYYADRERVDEALKYYDEAIKLDPKNNSLLEEAIILRAKQ